MRERTRLAIGAAVVALASWLWGVYWPLQARFDAAVTRRDKAGERLEQVLELTRLDRDLAPLLKASGAGMNLLTRLEQLLGSLELRDRLAQIRQSQARKPADGSPPARDAALVRLDRLDLQQLTAVLDALDRLERNIVARRVEIRLQEADEASITLEMEELPLE